MNTAKIVDQMIDEQKASGAPLQEVAWNIAKACIGWPYVFGAVGEYCDPENRRSYYNSHGADHPTIKSKCKNFSGTGSCSGCQFYPGGRTRFYDCRGFTRWVLKKVFGWVLQGGGCTSQWNTASNWTAKGRIADGVPENTLVCLFYSKDGKEKTWEHTGFGWNNETCECSVGVQYFPTRNKKWTHWAIPACVGGEAPPGPVTKPTLRRGDKGEYVTLLQTKLVTRGYDIGSYGVDGAFGRATEAAVKSFQTDSGLASDGICGPKTWDALDDVAPTLYTVTVPRLTKSKAEELCRTYVGAVMTEEGG